MTLRYHLDENMPRAVAIGISQRGIDVTTTADADLLGASDGEQLAHALSENRVIVSEDDDLLALHSQGVAHAGIAFVPPRRRSVGQVILKLVDLSRERTPEGMHGRVEFV